MIRSALLKFLNQLFPPEQPTEQELRTWAWEQATKERMETRKLCYIHGGEPVELRCISEGVWVCEQCQRTAPLQRPPLLSAREVHYRSLARQQPTLQKAQLEPAPTTGEVQAASWLNYDNAPTEQRKRVQP